MYIELYCSKCGDSSLVSFSTLYEVWRVGYETMCPEHKKKAKAVTDIKCHCGNKERYDEPMMKYIFQLIFDEYVKEEEV